MQTSHHPYWLAAMYLPDIGPITFLRWLENFPDIESLFKTPADELSARGFTPLQIHHLQHPNWQRIDADLLWSRTPDHHIIALNDPTYPPLLKEIADPPLVLFVRGNLAALTQTQFAVVGARNATPTGLKNAEYFAKQLATAGLAVTSGLALGVDGASHRGALAARGVTIGVTGHGLHHTYPMSHKRLIEDILAQQGAIISEFPLATKPLPAYFPQRNRIIAGMSVGVLVVEAALKSGSLITARYALENGRDVFAIPGSIHNHLAKGCHHLLRQGAKLVESINDIVEELGSLVTATLLPPAPQLELIKKEPTMAQREILALIDYEITPIDVILLRSGLTAGELSSILLILELNGYIQSVPGGYVRAILNQ